MKNILQSLECALIGIAEIGASKQAFAQARKAPKWSIIKIVGDLYRFKNNFHASVFLVSPNGVIATDPIITAAAKLLKAKIKNV